MLLELAVFGGMSRIVVEGTLDLAGVLCVGGRGSLMQKYDFSCSQEMDFMLNTNGFVFVPAYILVTVSS